MKLTEPSPVVTEAFLKDEIGTGHALLVAKLQSAQQEEALTACFREDYVSGDKPRRILLPVRQLQEWIERHILLELDSAPFPKDDPGLVPEAGACLTCPKRTGSNSLLFAEIKADACKLCGIWANCKYFSLARRRQPWGWPIDLERYDRSSALTAAEEDMLTRYAEAYRFYRYDRTMDFGKTLDRLVKPLNDSLNYTGIRTYFRKYVLLFFLREMAERRRSFWGWTTDEWIVLIDSQKTEYQHVVAVAYLLCGFSDLHRLRKNQIVYVVLARKVFGREYMKVVGDRVQSLLREWGYMKNGAQVLVLRTIFEGLLYIRSPHLDGLSVEDLQAVIARRPARTGSYCMVAFSRVLASMGTVPEALEIKRPIPDKILRLRVGCIRWQKEDATVPSTGEVLPANAVLPARRASQQNWNFVHEACGSLSGRSHCCVGEGTPSGLKAL